MKSIDKIYQIQKYDWELFKKIYLNIATFSYIRLKLCLQLNVSKLTS